MEERTITVSLNGVGREVIAWRMSPDHCWFLRDAVVLCRFITGQKINRVTTALVHVDGSRGFVQAQRVYGYRGRAVPVAWAAEDVGGPVIHTDYLAKPKPIGIFGGK